MPAKPEIINPPELGKHPGYSQAVKVNAGSLLFISGQVGWDEHGRFVSTDFAAQFRKALENIITVVRAAGGQAENIARLTIYVLDKREYLANTKAVGQAYRDQMGKHYPAMTLVEVKGLLEDDARLELEATAAF